MIIHDIDIAGLDGAGAPLADLDGHTVLVVNVASKCGLTPQYEGLERLHDTYADRGFSVLGVPCNQFGGQEPGTSEEIAEFCSATYGVSFPMTEKVDVNGGDIRWNFEKFLVAADGNVQRFGPQVEPDDPALVAAITSVLV